MNILKAYKELPTGTRLYPQLNGDVRVSMKGCSWEDRIEDHGVLDTFRPFVSRCQVCMVKHAPACPDPAASLTLKERRDRAWERAKAADLGESWFCTECAEVRTSFCDACQRSVRYHERDDPEPTDTAHIPEKRVRLEPPATFTVAVEGEELEPCDVCDGTREVRWNHPTAELGLGRPCPKCQEKEF